MYNLDYMHIFSSYLTGNRVCAHRRSKFNGKHRYLLRVIIFPYKQLCHTKIRSFSYYAQWYIRIETTEIQRVNTRISISINEETKTHFM